jgi:hypothetical protein
VDDEATNRPNANPRIVSERPAPVLLACVVGLVGAWLGLALLARETVPMGPFRVELDVGFGRGETVLGLPPFGALTATPTCRRCTCRRRCRTSASSA